MTEAAPKPCALNDVQTQVRNVLLELMIASESDTVRVAAAKALIDKILKDETPKMADAETAALKAALIEAHELLKDMETMAIRP